MGWWRQHIAVAQIKASLTLAYPVFKRVYLSVNICDCRWGSEFDRVVVDASSNTYRVRLKDSVCWRTSVSWHSCFWTSSVFAITTRYTFFLHEGCVFQGWRFLASSVCTGRVVSWTGHVEIPSWPKSCMKYYRCSFLIMGITGWRWYSGYGVPLSWTPSWSPWNYCRTVRGCDGIELHE